MATELLFIHDAGRRRYRAERGGVEVAFSDVDPIGALAVLIKHTEVPKEHEGHGYGSALVRHILGEARASGRTVMPVCPFAADYLRRHPEYADLVHANFRTASR